MDAFLQGAVRYVGEAACRRKGLMWRYWPFNGDGGVLPDLFGSGEPGIIDTRPSRGPVRMSPMDRARWA